MVGSARAALDGSTARARLGERDRPGSNRSSPEVCDISAAGAVSPGMKKSLLALGVIAALAGGLAPRAEASCVPLTAAQKRAAADAIFDGVALEGPTASGVQRFRVSRYLKGSGPRIVRVDTGFKRRADGTGSITSISLYVRRGERWRIFADGSTSKILTSNQCAGSRKLP